MKANLKNERFFLRLIKEGKLKVTSAGKAFNLVTGREIAKAKGDGYRKLSWLNPETGKIVQVQLHRIVWARFKGVPDDPDLEVNHMDGGKQNCALSNLELDTSTHNNRHAQSNNLVYHPRGEERPNAVFTDEEVSRYRRLYRKGAMTAPQIAKRAGCSTTCASYMLDKKTYKHVD